MLVLQFCRPLLYKFGKYDKVLVNRLKPYAERNNIHTITLHKEPKCFSLFQEAQISTDQLAENVQELSLAAQVTPAPLSPARRCTRVNADRFDAALRLQKGIEIPYQGRAPPRFYRGPKLSQRRCFNCREKGHAAAECTLPPTVPQRRNKVSIQTSLWGVTLL